MRQSTFCWIFPITTYVLRVRGRRYEESYWCAKIARTGGKIYWEWGRVTWGWNIARSVLSLIFTFPLIFTWTRGQTRYHDTSRTLFVKQLSRVTNKIRSDTYRWHTLRCVVMGHFFPSEWISAIDIDCIRRGKLRLKIWISNRISNYII